MDSLLSNSIYYRNVGACNTNDAVAEEEPTQLLSHSEDDVLTQGEEPTDNKSVPISFNNIERETCNETEAHDTESSIAAIVTAIHSNKITPIKTKGSHSSVSDAQARRENHTLCDKISDKKRKSTFEHTELTDDSDIYSELRLSEISTQTTERSKAWFPTARAAFNEKARANINPVSFNGIKRRQYQNESTKLEIEISPDTYCSGCKQLHEHCHLKVHSNYIRKKLFATYRDQSELYGKVHIMASVKDAYNECRRVDYCNRFRFYDTTEEDLPGCLERIGNQLVSTVQELRNACIINGEVKEGIVQLLRTKRFRRA